MVQIIIALYGVHRGTLPRTAFSYFRFLNTSRSIARECGATTAVFSWTSSVVGVLACSSHSYPVTQFPEGKFEIRPLGWRQSLIKVNDYYLSLKKTLSIYKSTRIAVVYHKNLNVFINIKRHIKPLQFFVIIS